MSKAFPVHGPGWAAQVWWSWLGATAVGLSVEVLELLLDGQLDLGPPAVVALLMAPALLPGGAGALTALALFWHAGLRGYGRAAALIVGLGTGGVVVGALDPGGLWLVVASVIATGAAMFTMAEHRAVAVALALLPAVAFTAAGRLDRPDAGPGGGLGPNLLLITVDSLRADRVGGHRIDTAGFDRVAAEGVRFGLAMSPVPSTAPSAVSILAAESPWQHGVWRDGDRVPPTAAWLPRSLQTAGWSTAAFVSSVELHHELGFADGFDVYDDDLAWVKGLRSTALGRAHAVFWPVPAERRAQHTVDRALRWMRGAPEPWFVWVHLSDPRGPYQPPPPFDERYYSGRDARDPGRSLPAGIPDLHAQSLVGVTDPDYVVAQYNGEVAYADAQLGRLLARLDRVPPTRPVAVAVTGLMGESLGERAAWFRHDSLDEASLHVPLALRLPGRIAPGGVVHAPVELADLGATLLDYATATPAGRSLRPAIHGAAPPGGGTARSALTGAPGRRPAASLRGQQVRYLLMDGPVPVERAWLVSIGGTQTELFLDGSERDGLRLQADRLLESMP